MIRADEANDESKRVNIEKGAAYIRVSTEDQTEYSPDAQLYTIRQYAEKNGIMIADNHVFRDEGISGKRADKRPGFMRMISMAKSKPKPFGVILVHKFDRFARNREDSIVYKSLLRKECGIKVVSVTERIEDDKFSVILESMLEAMAEYYSLNLGDEVKKGMAEKARRGELQTPAPFGYRMDNGVLKICGDESEIIKWIYEKYALHSYSLRRIAREINAHGYRTIKDNYFDKRAIEYIIRNPVYAGKLRWSPEGGAKARHGPDTMIVEGRHEPIIDIALWEAANEKNRLNRVKCKVNGFSKYDGVITTHWLRGLVKCSECGSTLSYGRGGGGRDSAFRCNKYLNGGCASPQRITVSKLEKALIDAIEADTRAAFDYTYEKQWQKNNDMPAGLRKMVAKTNVKLERALFLFLEGIDTDEEYKKNKQALLDERKKIEDELRVLETDCKGAPISCMTEVFLNDWLSMDEKNRILKEIIKKIVYDKQGGRLEIHYYLISHVSLR